MADKDSDGMWSTLGDVFKSYGPGVALIFAGLAISGISIYRGPEYKEAATQLAVLAGGSVMGLFAIALGVVMLWRAPAVPAGPGPTATAPDANRRKACDLFIAAPMAGFGNDEAGLKKAVELVIGAQQAMERLSGIESVHSPAFTRPNRDKFESAATAFNVELDSLRGAKRYLLILPELPAQTSVLMTIGAAITLNIPCAILAKAGTEVPYLLQGAVDSKRAQVRLERYSDLKDIENIIAKEGLRLFGEDP